MKFANYRVPSPETLAALKAGTGLTGDQLADLIGLSDGQWRNYIGGNFDER